MGVCHHVPVPVPVPVHVPVPVPVRVIGLTLQLHHHARNRPQPPQPPPTAPPRRFSLDELALIDIPTMVNFGGAPWGNCLLALLLCVLSWVWPQPLGTRGRVLAQPCEPRTPSRAAVAPACSRRGRPHPISRCSTHFQAAPLPSSAPKTPNPPRSAGDLGRQEARIRRVRAGRRGTAWIARARGPSCTAVGVFTRPAGAPAAQGHQPGQRPRVVDATPTDKPRAPSPPHARAPAGTLRAAPWRLRCWRPSPR
jgi:hypothetical protein